VTVEDLTYVSDSIAAIYDVHCILAGHALMYGADFLKQQHLRPMPTGEKIGCLATTEPTASTDLSIRALKPMATKEGNKYVVNGQKRFITNARVADFVISSGQYRRQAKYACD